MKDIKKRGVAGLKAKKGRELNTVSKAISEIG